MLPKVCAIAKQAGKEILSIYDKEYKVVNKNDNTPVTDADIKAHNYIVKHLSAISPNIPVLSEESDKIEFSIRKKWFIYWLIDPLDGTKEFIAKTGEFSVNIALIINHRSVLGVIYSPCQQLLYYAAIDLGAWRSVASKVYKPACLIRTRKIPDTILSIVGSHSRNSKKMQNLLKKIGKTKLLSMGSSIKSCLVADGSVDIYPRFGPTSEWDTAAAQCIVEEARGAIVDLNLQPLRYNTKSSLLNPEFLVIGDLDYNWKKLLEQI